MPECPEGPRGRSGRRRPDRRAASRRRPPVAGHAVACRRLCHFRLPSDPGQDTLGDLYAGVRVRCRLPVARDAVHEPEQLCAGFAHTLNLHWRVHSGSAGHATGPSRGDLHGAPLRLVDHNFAGGCLCCLLQVQHGRGSPILSPQRDHRLQRGNWPAHPERSGFHALRRESARKDGCVFADEAAAVDASRCAGGSCCVWTWSE
mmetsp:Transcript_11240/g.31425  ORF Transcript_11240/g.31425 Transcript_11240/m.31425 type:complete len:203 (+) Transcript_11240:169-777(+)